MSDSHDQIAASSYDRITKAASRGFIIYIGYAAYSMLIIANAYVTLNSNKEGKEVETVLLPVVKANVYTEWFVILTPIILIILWATFLNQWIRLKIIRTWVFREFSGKDDILHTLWITSATKSLPYPLKQILSALKVIVFTMSGPLNFALVFLFASKSGDSFLIYYTAFTLFIGSGLYAWLTMSVLSYSPDGDKSNFKEYIESSNNIRIGRNIFGKKKWLIYPSAVLLLFLSFITARFVSPLF